jgi:hypothetical protein
MKAHVGDRLIVDSLHVGEAKRIGVIESVEHPDGTPPYVVRWLADDHVSTIFPGPECRVEESAQPHSG